MGEEADKGGGTLHADSAVLISGQTRYSQWANKKTNSVVSREMGEGWEGRGVGGRSGLIKN